MASICRSFFIIDNCQPPTWNLTINDTEPIFLYCAAPGSCINQQMVAVINANSSESLATQQQDAAGSTYQLAPGDQFPSEDRGTPADATQPSTTGSKSMTAPSIPSTSSQSMTAPSITSTSSQSMANPTTLSTTSGPSSSSNNHSRISGGVIVGIVVAVIFVVGLIGALLFLIGRHKTLLQFTHRQRHAGHPGSYSSSNPMAETRMFSPSFHQSTKDSSNLYHFPSPPMKTRFSISEHPAFANSESTDPETGPGVPPYSPLALSPPLGRSPNHIAELAAQAENANGPGTIPRSSSRLSTSRTRSRSSDPLRQQPQQQIQRLSGQQPSNRRPELEKERKCQKEGPKEANSWQKSSSTRSQERDETSGYWSYDSNQHVEEDVCPAATNSSSDAEQAPDSPTLGSVRRR